MDVKTSAIQCSSIATVLNGPLGEIVLSATVSQVQYPSVKVNNLPIFIELSVFIELMMHVH